MYIVVNVHLKKEILDPQGRAVQSSLNRLGVSDLVNVRQGKQFILSFDGEISKIKLVEIEKIAETLLSNPVIETYTVEVKE